MDKYVMNIIHFFLILYPCVKASNNLICDSFCCVSNFTYKFIMREKEPAWLDSPWITARRSSCCVSATMFSLQLCDLKWQQQRHQNRRGRRLLGPKWAFPAHSGIWARASRTGEKEQTQQLRGGRLQAHHTFLALPRSSGKQEYQRERA